MARLTRDVLVVNAGSTSLKLAIVDEHDDSRVIESLAEAPSVVAVGHRVVHGGDRFSTPTVIDDDVAAELAGLVELAPLHNKPAVEAIRKARKRLPGVPHVAVFDTAFHSTLPALARTYLLPERFRARGIRRFGFHGLSVEWASERVRVPRLVVCHLGGGSSVTAVRDGRSVDTTMGFTPLEGVPMATRAGSLDPGALLYLLRHGVALAELDHALEHESGLTALAGSGDVAELERTASSDSQLALDIYCYRVAQAVASMATALEGIDALVFTAGVGEHSIRVRAAICGRLAFLGVVLDEEANRHARGETEIAVSSSRVRVTVVPSREDVVVARAVRATVGLQSFDRETQPNRPRDSEHLGVAAEPNERPARPGSFDRDPDRRATASVLLRERPQQIPPARHCDCELAAVAGRDDLLSALDWPVVGGQPGDLKARVREPSPTFAGWSSLAHGPWTTEADLRHS